MPQALALTEPLSQFVGDTESDALPHAELDGDAGCVVGTALQLVDAHDDTLTDGDPLPLTLPVTLLLALSDGETDVVAHAELVGVASCVVGSADRVDVTHGDALCDDVTQPL